MKNRFFCTFILLVLYTYSFAHFSIIEPKHTPSGNLQHAAVSHQIAEPLQFYVITENNTPAAGVPIEISIVSTPENAEHTHISDSIIYTNTLGIAQTYVTLGNVAGTYQIAASIENGSKPSFCIYTLHARASNWWIFLLLGLSSGLILFLFGIHLMSGGLQKAAGDKMRSILSSLTRNNFIGIGVGALITMIVQSSGATSAMLVGFVNSGLIRFRQTLSILLGTAIGSTITAQLIAFKLTDYSLGMIAIGGILYLFLNKPIQKNWGQAILGFGILFFGMEIMSDAMSPLHSFQSFVSLLYTLENPLLGILVGTIFTAVIQSSAAFIGIMIAFASQGLLTVDASIALILGANLGTPSTALLASIKTTINAKRVAIALLMYKVFLVLLFIGFVPYISDFIQSRTPISTPLHETLPRQIANIHTVFNIVFAIIIFPFLKQFEKLIYVLVPSKETGTEIMTKNTRYISNKMLGQPAIALQLAKEEIVRISKKIQISLELIMLPFLENDEAHLSMLETQRDEIKAIRDEIRAYLLKIKFHDNSKTQLQELFTISHTLSELSHINDALTKTLHRRAEKWIERNYAFSEAEYNDIKNFHASTIQLFTASMRFFSENNIHDVFRIKNKANKQTRIALELEKKHFMRLLKQEPLEMMNSKTYLELINMFKIIGNHAVNISKAEEI